MLIAETRTDGDYAGVFEYDGQSGYFYLVEMEGELTKKVTGALRIMTGPACFTEGQCKIKWDAEQRRVALFIMGTIWALFDLVSGSRYWGDLMLGDAPTIPPELLGGFK